MPSPYPKSYDPYSKCWTLAQCPPGELIVVRCRLCVRTTHFLAADLAKIKGLDWCALDPPFPCSKCGRIDYIRVDKRQPEAGDYGSLIIRRPTQVVTIQKWKSVRLGD